MQITSTDPAASAPAMRQSWAYRLAIPAIALCLFAALAALWHWGPRPLYFDALRLLGIDPFRFPFLDIHAVLAAAECQRQGVDVYLSNPCDALGRPHVYSPLWLSVTPGFLDTRATMWVGLSLGLLFVLSLPAVIRPASAGEVLVLALAALSPMTVYAVERANNDVVVFLLILWGCVLDRAPRPYRLGCYALYLAAGLLKYYPLVLLVLIVRERWRDASAIAAVAGAALALFAVCDHAELGKALANIPAPSYFANSFSARNLPFGLTAGVAAAGPRSTLALLLLGLLVAVAAARTWRTFRMLSVHVVDWNGGEAECLVVGAMLLTACFFAGQNIDYRGVYFVLVMPGLVRLHAMADGAIIRRFLAQMIAVALFATWEELIRRGLHAATAMLPVGGLGLRTEVLFWTGRELAWWWLISSLAAIVLCRMAGAPLVGDSLVALPRLRFIGSGRERARG